MATLTGTVYETEETLSIEWKIGEFLSLPNSVYKSREYNFLGSLWHLKIYPFGQNESKEDISLYLCANKCNIVVFEFCIKKPYDTMRVMEETTWKFDESGKGYGSQKILRRSELLERKEELMTLGTLTVICNLKSVPLPTELNTTFFTGLKNILASKKHSDVTLRVKDQVFEAHKIILAASSEVFSAMFEHDMTEASTGEVNITDCDAESFQDFLNFLYARRTDITVINVFELYETAHKYSVKELMNYCVAFLMKNLSVDNFCDVATLGHQYAVTNLNNLCKVYFKENIQKILLSKQWKFLLENHYLVAHEHLCNIATKIKLTN